MKSLVAGIDASLTGTAVVVLHAKTGKIHYRNTYRNKLEDITRLAYIKTELCFALYDMRKNLNAVFIEGYGLSFRGCDFKLAELGGVIRLAVSENMEVPYYEIAPTTLKMFITGNGRSPKNIMLEQIFRKYKIGSENLTDDNQVDAFGLAKFGIAYLHWKETGKTTDRTAKEINSFKKIKGPHVVDKNKAYHV